MNSTVNELLKLERRFGDLIQKSPKTRSEMQEKEIIRESLTKLVRQQAKPLFDELAQVDIRIESVWDLVNSSTSYKEAIPILIKHLRKPYHRRNKEGIVRALAVKEAKGIASKAVMDEYRKTPKEDRDFRWAFGNTMRVIVTEADTDELIEIVLDESNLDSREMFVRALAKLKSPKVPNILKRLANDKSKLVSDEAKKALKRKVPAR